MVEPVVPQFWNLEPHHLKWGLGSMVGIVGSDSDEHVYQHLPRHPWRIQEQAGGLHPPQLENYPMIFIKLSDQFASAATTERKEDKHGADKNVQLPEINLRLRYWSLNNLRVTRVRQLTVLYSSLHYFNLISVDSKQLARQMCRATCSYLFIFALFQFSCWKRVLKQIDSVQSKTKNAINISKEVL